VWEVCPAPAIQREGYAAYHNGLGGHRWILADQPSNRNLFPATRRVENTRNFLFPGADVSWWLAGTSMVATTFAADTPLLVTGLVATQGASQETGCGGISA